MGISLDQEIVMATVINGTGFSGSSPGRKKIFYTAGEAGNLSLPWLEAKAAEAAQLALNTGAFSVARISNPDQQNETVTLMIEPFLLPPELIVLGGGHVALPLVKVGKLIGYRVVVIDDRAEFASEARTIAFSSIFLRPTGLSAAILKISWKT
ncbi:MAG: XdhC family protein [Firmicutes bacterium]|nr:XdhC family protein [Bacillota bacterium]